MLATCHKLLETQFAVEVLVDAPKSLPVVHEFLLDSVVDLF